jgi:hypothetical protein
MRTISILVIVVAVILPFVSCRSTGLRAGANSREAWVCTQCNVVCASGDNCPACKGELKVTGVTRACPRCNMQCWGDCPVCGVHSVPAIRYYRCPMCGRTLPMAYDTQDSATPPKCPGCKWDMMPQTVPLRAHCSDCGIWSSRIGPCPRCGIDMSPM